MPVIAGVLILISEAGGLLGLFVLYVGSVVFALPGALWLDITMTVLPFFILPFLAIAIVAVIGGIYCIQRKRWGLALAGAIIAMLPFSVLGLVAVILVAMSREEFD